MNIKRYLLAVGVLSAMAATPALAQSIDTSAVNSFLTSVLDALTGTTGRLLMTIVAIGVLVAGALSYIDWSRVIQVLLIIVAIGGIPTIIQSIWGSA